MKVQRLKERTIEFIKYDFNEVKLPLVLIISLYIKFLKLLSKHEKAFDLASQIFRTGWKGSDKLGLKEARYYFIEKKQLGGQIVAKYLSELKPIGNTTKFVENPLLLLDGVITVLKNPLNDEKGAIVIKYSYYFSLFLKVFDVDEIGKRFHIIFEPSWAGLCEVNILAYTQFKFPIFLQVYEDRDKSFIESLKSNIIPVDVGPSWFINHEEFGLDVNQAQKDIDIIMVAAWAKFKRHQAFFQAVKPLITSRPELNITLVGYPVDMTKEQVMSLADKFNLKDNLTIYEWIKPEEVAALQSRAKVNVLWSKFEGNNRAIIEGMFCDSPAILREGHNYGQSYDYINNKTGCYANEKNLSSKLSQILDGKYKFSPRSYVMKNRNCIVGTQRLNEALKIYELSVDRKWTTNLVVKTNQLHGMKYFMNSAKEFQDSYEWLQQQLILQHPAKEV